MHVTYPPRAVILALMRRAAGLWMVVRGAFLGMELFAGLSPTPLGVAGLCGVLAIVDTIRLRERALWGNLAITRTTIGVTAAAVAALAEFGMYLLEP